MVGFVQYKCVLPSNKSNIYFLDSNENIRKELDDISFRILPTNSICKACLALVNKRGSFKERLCELDNTITNVHETALNAIGIPLKVKRNVVRKLGSSRLARKLLCRLYLAWNRLCLRLQKLDVLTSFNSLTGLYEWQAFFELNMHLQQIVLKYTLTIYIPNY
jgi:hypothetical protein